MQLTGRCYKALEPRREVTAVNMDLEVIIAQVLMCTIPVGDMRGNAFTDRISGE